MRSLSLASLFLLLLQPVLAQKTIQITSPDGSLKYAFKLKDKKASYSVSFKTRPIIADAALSLTFSGNSEFKNDLTITEKIFREAAEQYELIVGKTKKVNHPFREVTIKLKESTKPFRITHLVVRAFNDGLAFRYEFPQQENWSSYTLTDEGSTFRFVDDPRVLTLFLPNFTTSHEGEYSSVLLSEIKEDSLMDMPTLFQLNGPTYLAITEAALVDYAGMYLIKHNGVLKSQLSPLPGQDEIKVKADLPHHSPWRVLMISDRIGALIESNILTSLNEPCKIKDISWIKTGKTTFPWWNGSIIPDTSFEPGNNFENNKYYIDFCARNGLEFHSVVESNGHEWYTNDGVGYQPGHNADVTRPVAGIDMQQICDYAKEKGVGIRVWVHWKALYPKLDTAFTLFEKWGIKGMMVDFMDRDDQEMTNIKEEILIKAAKHKLHIQFHGSEKPTGLSRTYPNEFTREGTLNYEVNKWEKRVTPDHDLNIVFTRMLAGSTDYHLGGFRAVPDSLWKVQYTRPLMMGTRCHMLAMYVVLENYQGMVCDYPAAYEGQQGFEFIRAVPTIWDETKVIDAKIGAYITTARRKGDDWFIGSITNHEERSMNIDFAFLSEGEYVVDAYTDSKNAYREPNELIHQTRTVTKTDTISIWLAGGGGAVMQVRKK